MQLYIFYVAVHSHTVSCTSLDHSVFVHICIFTTCSFPSGQPLGWFWLQISDGKLKMLTVSFTARQLEKLQEIKSKMKTKQVLYFANLMLSVFKHTYVCLFDSL